MVGYTLETWCSNAKGVTAWGIVRNGTIANTIYVAQEDRCACLSMENTKGLQPMEVDIGSRSKQEKRRGGKL
jgi:hypothetical protein